MNLHEEFISTSAPFPFPFPYPLSPIGVGWNKKPYSPEELIEVLEAISPAPTGFGLLTGTPVDDRNVVISVDIDGQEANVILQKLAEYPLPKTVAFSSGKPGRCQQLFSVPFDYPVRSRKFEGGLELRCAGLMSVLPPSIHPETKRPYSWLKGCSPLSAIAPAPEWLKELISSPKPRNNLTSRSSRSSRSRSNSQCNVVSLDSLETSVRKYPEIKRLLAQLAPFRCDSYHEWIRIGLALRSHGEDLLPLWDWWSQQSSKYSPGECGRVWQYFHPRNITLGTLIYLARIDGNAAT